MVARLPFLFWPIVITVPLILLYMYTYWVHAMALTLIAYTQAIVQVYWTQQYIWNQWQCCLLPYVLASSNQNKIYFQHNTLVPWFAQYSIVNKPPMSLYLAFHTSNASISDTCTEPNTPPSMWLHWRWGARYPSVCFHHYQLLHSLVVEDSHHRSRYSRLHGRTSPWARVLQTSGV